MESVGVGVFRQRKSVFSVRPNFHGDRTTRWSLVETGSNCRNCKRELCSGRTMTGSTERERRSNWKMPRSVQKTPELLELGRSIKTGEAFAPGGVKPSAP